MSNTEVINLQDNCLLAIGKSIHGIQGIVPFEDRDILLNKVSHDKVLDKYCNNPTLFHYGFDKYLSDKVYNILITHRANSVLKLLRK